MELDCLRGGDGPWGLGLGAARRRGVAAVHVEFVSVSVSVSFSFSFSGPSLSLSDVPFPKSPSSPPLPVDCLRLDSGGAKKKEAKGSQHFQTNKNKKTPK